MKDLKDLVRPNVWNMKPYSSARDEFQGNASVFLDANENPFNRPYNRYPDPLQWELKKKIAEIKGVKRESIFLGNGSDEPIDLIIRAFCEPSIDSIVSIDPSYGMYEVAANVNNVEFRKIKLDRKFDLDTDSLLARDWCFNTQALRGEVQRQVGFKRCDASQLHATWWTQRILRDLRTNIRAFHFHVNAKFVQRVANNLGVVLNIARIGRILLFLEQIEARCLPIWIARHHECRLLLGCLILLDATTQG